MSSTNKTTNYELSQFLGSDKPAWLSDYNTDMSKIDLAMKANNDAATAAGGSATAANTAIGTLANLTTETKTDLVSAINDVNTTATSAGSTAGTASTNANSALLKANAVESALNINSFTTYTNMTVVSGASASFDGASITVAKNTDGSLAKIYGSVNITSSASSGSCTIKVATDSGLRPSEDITISHGGYAWYEGSLPINVNIVVKTTGEVDLVFNKPSNKYTVIKMIACLYFIKQFGDPQE